MESPVVQTDGDPGSDSGYSGEPVGKDSPLWQAGLLEAALEADHESRRSPFAFAPEVPGFEIISRLGAGASGEVWLAEELEPERTVALKIMRSRESKGASQDVLQREIRILAKLIHPNLVLLYHGIVTRDGRLGLAMEWIDGWPLDEWLERHPDLSLSEKLDLFSGVVRGVAFLHAHGVIHRDLKPANVIVDTRGVAKIVDFGLARLHQEGVASGREGDSIGVAGTLHFMAPEQAANAAGARAMPVDVYALGLILYRILAGKWLSPAEATPSETLAMVLNPPPLALDGDARDLPRDLQAILRQSLAPVPALRYQHARELEADLECFADKMPVSARRHTIIYLTGTLLRRQARRSLLAGVLVLAGLVAGGMIYQRHRRVAERNEANLRYAYSLTSFTLRQLRDELRAATLVGDDLPATREKLPAADDGGIPPLPVNAAGELDLRYFRAMLADLRSASSEGRSRHLEALKSIQTALDHYSMLALESPADPQRLLDAAQARLSFARLLGRVGRVGEAGDQALKVLGQVDRLAAWPGFDPVPLVPLRCDALSLMARQAHHAGDSAGAVRIAHEALRACADLPSGLLIRPENESMPRLAVAAADLTTYALAVGPSAIPETRLMVQQAATACRVALGKEPDVRALVCGLAQCLHALTRMDLFDGYGENPAQLFDEAARLLMDIPSDFNRSSLPLVWQISRTATDWATNPQNKTEPEVRLAVLDAATRLTVHLRRNGDGRVEVEIQRGRILLYQSRLTDGLQSHEQGARQIRRSLSLLRPHQRRNKKNLSLALLTAAALRQARGLAAFPETGWDDGCATHLEELLKQLTDAADELSPEQQRELASLKRVP